MLGASVLPWLKDSAGTGYTAWNVAVDIGWQFSNSLFSYGLLCVCWAIFAFFITYRQWQAHKDIHMVLPWYVRSFTTLGMCCLAPLLLFIWQYLFVDVHEVDVLAQHDVQILLIRLHLGYSVPGQVLPVSPFAVSNATFLGRLEIVLNHLSVGLLGVGASALVAIGSQRFFRSTKKHINVREVIGLIVGVLLLIIIFGRAPGALVCEYQAKQELAEGDYSEALQWLDAARTMNPQLEEVPYYHRELGQAWTALYPGEQSPDSYVYLAYIDRSQQNYLGAYHELLSIWQKPQERVPGWVVDEMSITLEQLAEAPQLHSILSTQRTLEVDLTALPWLQILSQIDNTNVYSAYVAGRIYYVQRSYDDCQAQMRNVIHQSKNAYVLSSAYTYLALSMDRQGNASAARQMLFEALQLDPYYHNNTAREELSGLH
jgi:tetratricopeptide (TPR) repeat protein